MQLYVMMQSSKTLRIVMLRMILILFTLLCVPTHAKILVDGVMTTGSINVDYFPQTWRQKPQYGLSAPAWEVFAEHYMSYSRLDRLTLATKGYGLWSKKLDKPVKWEKMKLQGTLFARVLPFIHLGYTVKLATKKPTTDTIQDKKQWLHGISLRLAW
ncbi:MAG: hypothetical protein VYC40_05165 [Pseudomonadota bacterium]|nr:hypothetical protein [Pseudomonadota bacterium]